MYIQTSNNKINFNNKSVFHREVFSVQSYYRKKKLKNKQKKQKLYLQCDKRAAVFYQHVSNFPHKSRY